MKIYLITFLAITLFTVHQAQADPTIGVTENQDPLAPQVYEAGAVDNITGGNSNDIDDVGALAMAASQIHFDPKSTRLQMGVGVGFYSGEQAVIWSTGIVPTENAPFLSMSLSSTGGDDDVAGGIGASWEF